MTDVEKLKQYHCIGCGIKLQNVNKERLGYVPTKTELNDNMVCQRCFRIKHYNDMSTVTLQKDDFLKILSHIGEKQCLVVNIVDLFDFEGSMISGLQRFVGHNPIILVVNKMDLLPKVTNWNKIVNWIQKQTKELGLKVMDIVLCSAKKNIGFDRVIESIDRFRGGKDVYVVGATNVGKSTLINRLIRDYSDMEVELTTSKYPGTTLDLVHIPLNDGKFIIDTPGIVHEYRLTELVAKRDLQTIMPDHVLKPAVYQLNEHQTLFFGGYVRFDFVQGERQSFTCYISNALKIHRTKLDKADVIEREHRGTLLTPPNINQLDELPPLVKHSLRIPKGAKSDVVISGLGWIKVNSDIGATIDVYAPKGVKVIVRNSLI